MRVEPYLNFDGRCDEAIEFYKSAVGAKVEMLMRFKDAPPAPANAECKPTPGTENKVMHCSLTVGDSRVMCTDGQNQGKETFTGISLSLTLSTDAEAQKAFAALGAGGSVMMPLGKTFFSSSFGMLKDKFGVVWMVIVMK
jgi:PhnB protein